MNCDSMLTDTMEVLINYAGLFDLEDGVKFAKAPIEDIEDDILLFEYLPTSLPDTYVQYIWFSKMCTGQSALVPPLSCLDDEQRRMTERIWADCISLDHL